MLDDIAPELEGQAPRLLARHDELLVRPYEVLKEAIERAIVTGALTPTPGIDCTTVDDIWEACSQHYSGDATLILPDLRRVVQESTGKFVSSGGPSRSGLRFRIGEIPFGGDVGVHDGSRPIFLESADTNVNNLSTATNALSGGGCTERITLVEKMLFDHVKDFSSPTIATIWKDCSDAYDQDSSAFVLDVEAVVRSSGKFQIHEGQAPGRSTVRFG
jgi:hypothetical protein